MTTILAPVGVESINEDTTPTNTEKIAIQAEHKITLLNDLQIRIAVSGGKITKLEINNAPIIRIPKTIVIAVKKAINIL